jgi:hypothetical protein
MDEQPRVLIGTPTYEGKEYCRKDFIANVNRITYKNAKFIMVDNSKGTSYAAKLRRDRINVVRTPRGRNSRDALANASNYLRDKVLKEGYDYLLMLESDIYPKPDVIQSLMSHMQTDSFRLQDGVRVVGAPYNITDGKSERLCVFIPARDEKMNLMGTRMLTEEEASTFLTGGLKQVHGMGVGCTLIHRSILEQFPFWYSELDDDRMQHKEVRKHPDVYFYLDMHNNKIKVFCDTSQYCLHTPSDWRNVKDI